ncbi:tRNA (N6-threonylcarbamoyladenosine(37)-N6)-methyltransferase TrmO [Arthrobacter monumenti]
MDTPMHVEPIGSVSSPREDTNNTTGWGDVVARIDLNDALGSESLRGLEGFSHVEVLFWFDQVTRRSSYAQPARARGRDDMPLIGVFAARGPNRPNPIGVSACEIVELGDTWLRVRGLDAVDGTPILDIKPVMTVLVPHPTQEPEWSSQLMADYYTG